MEFDFERLDRLPLADIERSAGGAAVLVRNALEQASALGSTFVLGRKSFRLAVARLPRGHRPLELLDQELGAARWERGARAHERVRLSLDLVPSLELESPRCLIWSSPVWRPRKVSIPGLSAVVEARREDLAAAVAELWAALFLEPVLERVPAGLRRLELAVGVTEDRPDARTALLGALADLERRPDAKLPLPGQAGWTRPASAFDRSVERMRASAGRSVLRRAFGTPVLTLGRDKWGPALHKQEFEALLRRQGGSVGASVARDLLGPVEPTPDVGMGGPRALDLARLGGQLALSVAQMAELGREVEQASARAEGRREWMAEMDLALLPDDGLRTTLEEQLALLSGVTDLALRAALASAKMSRTFAALLGIGLGELDLGVGYPLVGMLADFERSAGRMSTGHEREREVQAFGARYAHIYPRFDGQAQDSLRRAFELASMPGRPALGVERRLELARVRGDQATAELEARLPRVLASRVSPLRSVVEGASLLRERARMLEVLADSLLRTVALEVDRRLPRLEPGLPDGAVWHCHLEEIMGTVDLRGTSLRARVKARESGEAAYDAATRVTLPPEFGTAPLLAPTPLAQARGLGQVPWLIVAPERVSYAGRASDTLPCLARALNVARG